MSMPVEVFAPEQLTVNGVDLICPAWMVLDLADLWDPVTVYENRPSPGIGGTNPLPGIQDQLVASLPFKLVGSVDWEGNPYSSFRVGYRRNRRYLNNNLLIPGVAAALGAVYTSDDPTEDPVEFAIQIRGITWQTRVPSEWSGRLEVCLPDGAI